MGRNQLVVPPHHVNPTYIQQLEQIHRVVGSPKRFQPTRICSTFPMTLRACTMNAAARRRQVGRSARRVPAIGAPSRLAPSQRRKKQRETGQQALGIHAQQAEAVGHPVVRGEVGGQTTAFRSAIRWAKPASRQSAA